MCLCRSLSPIAATHCHHKSSYSDAICFPTLLRYLRATELAMVGGHKQEQRWDFAQPPFSNEVHGMRLASVPSDGA